MELVKTHYAGFGPTLATEALAERHAIHVGRETLRRWMIADGTWLSRKQRKTFHQPRLRRESYGELVQIDGSEHRWFEDRADPCTLLVFVDDATSKLMQLRFVPSESTESYFQALRGYLQDHGCPIAFYSDKHSVFRVVRQDTKGGQGMTQFGRALSELNIEILCANSSQAKGRVERANRTLQDRLVKELRLAGISDMVAGNAFLPAFMERYDERFAVPPAKTQDLHRPLRTTTPRLNDTAAPAKPVISLPRSVSARERHLSASMQQMRSALRNISRILGDQPDLAPEWRAELLECGRDLNLAIQQATSRMRTLGYVELSGRGP